MGEELEKLKVTVCDVSLEPRLGIIGIELHILNLNSKDFSWTKLIAKTGDRNWGG